MHDIIIIIGIFLLRHLQCSRRKNKSATHRADFCRDDKLGNIGDKKKVLSDKLCHRLRNRRIIYPRRYPSVTQILHFIVNPVIKRLGWVRTHLILADYQTIITCSYLGAHRSVSPFCITSDKAKPYTCITRARVTYVNAEGCNREGRRSRSTENSLLDYCWNR